MLQERLLINSMEILSENISDALIDEAYEIHKVKLGESYLSKEYFYKCRDKNEILVGIDNNEVLGYFIFEITTEKEFLSSKGIKNKGEDIPALCLLTVASKYAFKGTGYFLGKYCIEKYGSKVSSIYSPVWKSKEGTNAHKLLTRCGLVPSIELPNYWYKDSLGKENYCPVCGSPCECTLVIYKK